MLFFDGLFGLVMFGLWIFCLVDVITTPSEDCRNLPKLGWLIIVLLLAAVGSIVWLIAGRNWGPRTSAGPQPTATRPARPTSPDDDEEFLAGLRTRAEEQRRRAREAQEAQQHDERDQDDGLS